MAANDNVRGRFIVLTAGWIAAYARDSAGQVTSVTATQPGHSAVNIATSVTHMPFGPFNALTWGNGITDARTFDLDYRMTNIVDSTPSALQNLTYGWDADNNLKTITDAVTAANSQTLYSSANWLTGAVSGTGGYGTLSYTYDNNGNRKTDGATTLTYTSGTNRLSAIGSTSLSYISSGNITAIGANSMTYNKANQMASATVSSTTSAYVYDGFGQRVKVTVGAGTPSVTNYGPSGEILTETNSGTETDYLYLDGVPVSAIQPAAATISYIHTDHLGTPQIGTNASKTIVWQGKYQPFGAVTPSPATITQNLRFPGQQADVTGYNHNGFRDYNPGIGRYLEADPIGLAAGTNVYAYVNSNPMTLTDPLGLQDAEFIPIAIYLCRQFPALCVATISTIGNTIHSMSSANSPSSVTSSTATGQQCTRNSGNCTPEEHAMLQQRVENACGSAFSCNGTDSLATLNQKIGQQSSCINARRAINNRCFNGGDTGHQEAIQVRINAIGRCQGFLANFGR